MKSLRVQRSVAVVEVGRGVMAVIVVVGMMGSVMMGGVASARAEALVEVGGGEGAGSATATAAGSATATAAGSATGSATAAGSAAEPDPGSDPVSDPDPDPDPDPVSDPDPDPDPGSAPENATDIVGASLYPRGGELRLSLTLELDLSGHRGGARALSPDATWGITDETSLTLAHSARSIARIGHPGGACISTCDFRPSYTVNALLHHAILARTLAPRGLQLYLAGGLLVRDTDPWKPASLTGISLRFQRGRFALDTEPYLQLGLANTDRGNRHRLVVPLRLWIQPTCRWALGLFSGVEGELAVFSDAYHVPLALLASTRLTSSLSLSLSAGFSTLGGPLNTGGRRFGALTLETRL